MKKITGYMHQRETFGAVDGPGVRYVLFLQGCPLHCLYCHNPATLSVRGGTAVTVEDALADILRYKSFIKDGGVTISGGEPLLQPDFTLALIEACKNEGLHTAVDTSGFALPNVYEKIADAADLILLDIKAMDAELCRKITGHSNMRALAMLDYCEKTGKPVWIRHVVVPQLTLDDALLTELAEHIKHYSCIECVELLPFHKLGEHKWEKDKYTLFNTPEPTAQEMARVKRIFTDRGLKVR